MLEIKDSVDIEEFVELVKLNLSILQMKKYLVNKGKYVSCAYLKKIAKLFNYKYVDKKWINQDYKLDINKFGDMVFIITSSYACIQNAKNVGRKLDSCQKELDMIAHSSKTSSGKNKCKFPP